MIFARLQWKKTSYFKYGSQLTIVVDYTKCNVYGIDIITIISMTQLTTESNLITETHLVMKITINRYTTMSYTITVFFQIKNHLYCSATAILCYRFFETCRHFLVVVKNNKYTLCKYCNNILYYYIHSMNNFTYFSSTFLIP